MDDAIYNSLSFDVRFRIKLNGTIIKTNENGEQLTSLYGNQFFDHFLEQHRDSVFHFIQQITRETNVVERTLIQKYGEETRAMTYRGMLVDQYIYLVGRWQQQVNIQEKETTFPAEYDEDLLNNKIYAALNVAVLLFDEQNNIIYTNDVAHKYGLLPNIEIQSHPIFDMMVEMANEGRFIKKNVQRFYYNNDSLYHVLGIHNEKNSGMIFVIDDRACSEEFNSLIKHKQQMESVSHLAAGFAHELRNPLSVIRGFIQLSYLTKDITKYYQTIISEMDRMNGIIDDFLSLSRKTSKKHVHQPSEVLNSLIPIIRSECLLRNIKLDYDFEQTNKLLLLNESMIKQIILNLLRNSIEAFGNNYPKQKWFKIIGQVEDDRYIIRVKDNGPGMEEKVLKQLGKPFFTTKENGTGIGLPLCKKIIEDHDGHFNIESELEKGTTIIFSFPFI